MDHVCISSCIVFHFDLCLNTLVCLSYPWRSLNSLFFSKFGNTFSPNLSTLISSVTPKQASQTHSAYGLHRTAGAAHLSGAKLSENPHITECKSYSVKSSIFHSAKEWLNNLFMACDMHKVKLELSAGSFCPRMVLTGIL